MPPVECSRCRREIAAGATRYAVDLALYADYDGIVDVRDENLLLQAVREAIQRNPEEIEEQIYTERRYVLCPECRTLFLELLSEYEPLKSPPEGQTPDVGHGGGNYH